MKIFNLPPLAPKKSVWLFSLCFPFFTSMQLTLLFDDGMITLMMSALWQNCKVSVPQNSELKQDTLLAGASEFNDSFL